MAASSAAWAQTYSSPANPVPQSSAREGRSARVELSQVAQFQHQVTGVTVAPNGLIFVNFPRWTEDTATSVAMLGPGGELRPYPNTEWNSWRNVAADSIDPSNHWVCVQSVVADKLGNVWVLDPAAPAMGTIVKGGPKLVRIPLANNVPAQVILFDETVAPQGSYLNDVRFSPDGRFAYITDSGARGALVVVDLAAGKARRVLDGDPSTQVDKSVNVETDGQALRRPDGRGINFAADGIALSPDGRELYWQAIRGKRLYRIATEVLVNAGLAGETIADKVEPFGENGVADGLLISRAGEMYITSPQDDSVKIRAVNDGPSSKPRILVQDNRLRWPDTLSEGPDGAIYFTTSHIQDSVTYKPGASNSLATQLWRIEPKR